MTDTTCVARNCASERCNHRGWCWKHYTRWRRGQEIDDPSISEAILRRLDTSGGPDACWEWTGSRSPEGYGRLGKAYAHRLMLSLILSRQLNHDEHACHRCDNPPCANPRHLFVGSASDNLADMVQKGRHGGYYYDLDLDGLRWMYERGVSPDRISDLFGVSALVVRLRLDVLGLSRRPSGRPTKAVKERADRALAEYEAGLMVSRHGGAA